MRRAPAMALTRPTPRPPAASSGEGPAQLKRPRAPRQEVPTRATAARLKREDAAEPSQKQKRAEVLRRRRQLNRERTLKQEIANRVMVTDVPGRRSLLESRSVGAAAARDYGRKWSAFQDFCSKAAIRTRLPEELDRALTDYFDHLFIEGFKAEMAEKTMASVRFHRPDVDKKAGADLPRALRALKGFSKVSPPTSRFGLPWEWVQAILGVLAWRSQ